MGDAAAQWFSRCLGQPCRLVRLDSAQRRLSSLDWTGGAKAPNQFADDFPLLVARTAGLDVHNAQLAVAVQEPWAGSAFGPTWC